MKDQIDPTLFQDSARGLWDFMGGEPGLYRCSVKASDTARRTTGTVEILKLAAADLFPGVSVSVRKNPYGQPCLYLPSCENTQPYAAAANDCGVYIGMVAVLREGRRGKTRLAGTGIDLMFYATAEEMLLQSEPMELDMMFTASEQKEAFQKADRLGAARYLLKCVCLKEAAFKAISEALEKHGIAAVQRDLAYRTSFMEIEVSNGDAMSPALKLTGAIQELASQIGVGTVLASAVEGGGYVGAVAMAQREGYEATYE